MNKVFINGRPLDEDTFEGVNEAGRAEAMRRWRSRHRAGHSSTAQSGPFLVKGNRDPRFRPSWDGVKIS